MSWMQFVASLVGSLAWPVVVGAVVLAVWFATPSAERGGLLRRIRKVGPSGVELDAANAEVHEATRPLAETAPGLSVDARSEPPSHAISTAQINALIRAAAKWGWVRAGGTPSEFPNPLIVWTPGGATILNTSGKVNLDGAKTLSIAPGAFIDAHTGKPNTSAHALHLDRDVDDVPLAEPETQRAADRPGGSNASR